MTERLHRLLIVDDSREDREVIRRALAHPDHDRFEIVEVALGQDGLALCRAAPPDCVLLDHRLPDMDALAFLAALTADGAEVPVPVVVITGQGSELVAVQALKAGAHDYLVKGATPAEIHRAVRTAMERHARLPARTFRVLIIDDSPEDRATCRRRLARGRERFAFAEADTGAEGLALARSFDPDCVLLDYHLPDADGLEVLAALLHEPVDFAVLLLTGQGSEAVAVRALKAGAEDYLVKGPALATLPQAVRAALEKVSLRRRLAAQQRALERSQNQLRVTLASIGDGVIATDLAGQVTFMNPVAEALTGWPAAEARGRPLAEVFAIVQESSREPAENPALRALREGRVVGLANHTLLIARDGSERPIDDSAAPIRDALGEVFGAVLVFRDVTYRHRLEDELHQRVSELALAHRRKDEFLAMLAHELRNPLTPIKNALHILRFKGDEPQTVARMRALMERQVGHFARLVDDLLDVSRVTQGKLTLKPERLDLARLARDCAADHQAELERARVTLVADTPETPVWVSGDATRLSQVVDNFLTNALKFSNPGGEVAITVRADGERARLAVRDDGVGIEPEVLPTIFEVFAQADKSLARSPGGLGLGLAIVRGLVELHGGTVGARSEGLGRGAEFIVSLPLVREPPALSAAAEPRVGPRQRRRVLVVEDSHDSADSLRLLLEVAGYEVRLAATGRAGVELAATWRPELVICDIGLPEMDGYAVARALRQDPATAGAALIAVTGYGRDEDIALARAAGFDEHLCKPADPDALLALLARARRDPSP